MLFNHDYKFNKNDCLAYTKETSKLVKLRSILR